MTLLLAGDVGGTKTLLGIYSVEQGQLSLRQQRRYRSSAWDGLLPMLRDALADQAAVDAACLAVAGPVRSGEARLTNLGWTLHTAQLRAALGLARLELVNDFAVLIHGLPHLQAHQWLEVQEGITNPTGTVAILGAGTGLGMAAGHRQPRGGWLACPSEGSHGEFAPRTAAEWHMKDWLRRDLQLDRLSTERIVSGTGLGHVFRWCIRDGRHHPLEEAAALWRRDPSRFDLPAAVGEGARQGDATARRAVELWLGAYGSAAGDLALTHLCDGGLWIGGGTAARQIDGLRSAHFLEALHDKGRLGGYLRRLPIRLLHDPDAGLFSAACRARDLLDMAG